MKIKQRTKYIIATIATIFVGYNTMMDMLMPEWFFLYIFLAAIWGTFCFGVAENAYRKMEFMQFKEMPATTILGIIPAILGILAFIQIILIMQH